MGVKSNAIPSLMEISNQECLHKINGNSLKMAVRIYKRVQMQRFDSIFMTILPYSWQYIDKIRKTTTLYKTMS